MALSHTYIDELAAFATPFHAVEKHPRFTALRARLSAGRDRTIDPGDIAEMEARMRNPRAHYLAALERLAREMETFLHDTATGDG
jgi:hypothetical protein